MHYSQPYLASHGTILALYWDVLTDSSRENAYPSHHWLLKLQAHQHLDEQLNTSLPSLEKNHKLCILDFYQMKFILMTQLFQP